MSVYRLPDTLRSNAELRRVNREVHAGEIFLDWSGVGQASDDALAQLLVGFTITNPQHLDALGIATLQGGLEIRVLNMLTNVAPPAQNPPRVSSRKEPSARYGLIPAANPLIESPTPVQLRDELHTQVVRELVGPAGGPEEEVGQPRLRDRYLAGILISKRGGDDDELEPEEDDGLGAGGASGAEDDSESSDVIIRESMMPSSLGLTFYADRIATTLVVTASWGRYERMSSEHAEDGDAERVWKRTPVRSTVRLSLEDGDIEPIPLDPESPGVILKGRVRVRTDGWIVTLFLLNGQAEPPRLREQAWLFQAELSVEGSDTAPIFCCRPHPRRSSHLDRQSVLEEESAAMLYRNHPEFAVGHGVAVHAERTGNEAMARRLTTQAIPWYDVPQTDMPTVKDEPELAALEMDMRALADMDRATLLTTLQVIPRAYALWIKRHLERLHSGAEGLDGFRQVGERALQNCTDACKRIQAGIALLEASPEAERAFRFMNRAMCQQRLHTVFAEAVRRNENPQLSTLDLPKNRSWRLFQLAFILLNLPGVTDLHHPDRSAGREAVADLLWFPTGGGKTEAYLGLTAYTLAIRRLQGVVAGHDGGYGIAVLMRYTLRLLTLQQFQRAAALLCACELLRQDAWYDGDTSLGGEPFRIGLWVGARTTPNSTEASAEAIKQDRGARRGGMLGRSGTPAQLTNCPWCGSRIDPGVDISVETFNRGRGRTVIYCGDRTGECPFSRKRAPDDGLPVLVVDEEIYRNLPSLLISTVDKFAQMPWKGETQALFGRVRERCDRHGFRTPELDDNDYHPGKVGLDAAHTHCILPARPPDLIIQDELHLISGPLGTLVGLYETVVDGLSTWEVEGQAVRPKVIASTATIQRASEQVRNIFLRSVHVFPPHGLDVESNFFSVQRLPSEEFPGRRYIGLTAQGRRMKSALISVYVAHLAASEVLFGCYGAAADPWMTLVGYFTSLRDLGGMRRIVDDDIKTRLRRMDQRGLASRFIRRVEELTSRKASTDIPITLDMLEQVFDPATEKKARESRGKGAVRFPVDVLLATNMLSVGVDVKRLGLMVVAGQPKTTAEYIQATSRVGRGFPGLVCTVFNWSRPRDISHYERFEHYHATFYDQVEALSVTPFSPRARDRALSALLVAMVRLLEPEFNTHAGAAKITPDHPIVLRAMETIVARAVAVTGDEAVGADVRAELERRLDYWLREARNVEGGRRLGYVQRQDGITIPLLKNPGLGARELFTSLTSLRDVEPEIKLILEDGGLDYDPPASRKNRDGQACAESTAPWLVTPSTETHGG